MRCGHPRGKVPPALAARAASIEAHLRASALFPVGPQARAAMPDPDSPECARLAAEGALREAGLLLRLGVKVIGPEAGPQLRARRP